MLPAPAIRASILKYGWPNVAAAIFNEYGTVLENFRSDPERTLSASCCCSV
jgi:hypothetical protein